MINTSAMLAAAVSLVLLDEHRRMMSGVAAQAQAFERCGILLGHCADGRIVVDTIVSLRNFSRRPGGFVMSRDHIAQATARRPDQHFIGVFHTHKHMVTPSLTDTRSMAATRCVWLIAARQQLAAYRIAGSAIESVMIERG